MTFHFCQRVLDDGGVEFTAIVSETVLRLSGHHPRALVIQDGALRDNPISANSDF